MLLAILVMATLTLGLLFSGWLTPTPSQAQGAGGGDPPTHQENTNCDNPTSSQWCAASAQLVLSNVVINPPAPTNAPYDCIVSVCDTISANLQSFTVPSTNATQTCHTCDGSTPTNFCDPIVYTAGASPYNITNEWRNAWWQGVTSGIGDSMSFNYTNATEGYLRFDNVSAQMPTTAPGCGVSVFWAPNAHNSRTYAFVAVDSISCDAWNLVTNNPMPTYKVDFCPGTYVTVTASPSPGMDDKFLPGGWSMSGGLATTNSDGSPSRTKRLVDCGQIGTNVITATSGCSSQSLKVIVGAPYLNIVALSSGQSISSANSNDMAMVGQHIYLNAITGGSCGAFSNFQWSVPGYAIGGYNMGSGGSSDPNNPSTNIITPESLTTYFPTTNSTVDFYWVDGGAKTVSCSAVCGGVTCSTNVTINVTRPTVAMGSHSSPVWYASVKNIVYEIEVTLGDKGFNNWNYNSVINSPTDGHAVSVQIVNSFNLNGTEEVVGQQADGCVPYQGLGYSGDIRAGGTPNFSQIFLQDGPESSMYFGSVSLSANFDDYVMFQPDIGNTIYANLGGDTIYVPLGKVNWIINGGAYYTGYLSYTINPAIFSFKGPDNSTAFPIWNSIFVPHH